MLKLLGSDLVLLEPLAAGGMAEVYRARQVGMGGFEKTVAVKCILRNHASSKEFREMFAQEAKLCALLQHPNIVQVFANGEVDGYLYLVMEFIDGKNVRQMLNHAIDAKTQVPVDISCFIVTEMAKGLHYAHEFKDENTGESLHIVHRDVSPQNAVFSYDGAVKVIDFGIAKAAAAASNTRTGVLKGKFSYMAPELIEGHKPDRCSDVFALGIILYELLTQQRLFTADDELQIMKLVRDCKIPDAQTFNPQVDAALKSILLKALAKDPAHRYLTAGDLQADLQRYMNQTFPNFLSSQFSAFVRHLFAAEITEEKANRGKLSLNSAALAELRANSATDPETTPATFTKEKPNSSSASFSYLTDPELRREVVGPRTDGNLAVQQRTNTRNRPLPPHLSVVPPPMERRNRMPSPPPPAPTFLQTYRFHIGGGVAAFIGICFLVNPGLAAQVSKLASDVVAGIVRMLEKLVLTFS